MPFSIEPAIIFTLDFRPLMRRYDCLRSIFSNLVNQCLGRIASVSNHVFSFQICQQVRRLGNVVSLPACQAQPQRIPQAIHDNMHFGAESASATPQGLCFLSAAFFVRRQHTDVRVLQCCLSSHFPCLLPQRSEPTSVPTRLPRTNAKTACRQHSNHRTRWVAIAIGHRCALSILSLRQIGDSSPLVLHTLEGLHEGSPVFLSIGRLIISRLSFD